MDIRRLKVEMSPLAFAIHVFLKGCNFRCLLLENFEVLKWGKYRGKEGGWWSWRCRGAYLWLKWFSENEIMHFEESRFDGQRNIGWIWSDVSVDGEKNRNLLMPQCSAPLSSSSFNKNRFVSIFGYFFITWDMLLLSSVQMGYMSDAWVRRTSRDYVGKLCAL